MAKNISTTFSVDLGGVVENSINAVKTIRKTEQTRKETEFQKAVASGLSYEEQIGLREKFLEEEKASNFSDPDYILSLAKQITDTKKLSRYNKYRTKYATTFGELAAGKVNEQNYLDVLKNQLEGVDDPELRLEIQQDIAAAEKGLKTYNDTILANKVKLAVNDGTVKTLASMIAQVTIARTSALLTDNQDEVTAHDQTLAALNSQLASVRVEDATMDFQAKSTTKGTNALEKLEFMNSQVRDADPNVPIRMSDGNGNVKTYSSVQQFWNLQRDNYLSSTFFKELEADVKGNILVNSRMGITQKVLDDTVKVYKDLKNKPEMAAYLPQLDVQEASIMDTSVNMYADMLFEKTQATKENSFPEAAIEMQKVQTKYNIDLLPQLNRLQAFATQALKNAEAGGIPITEKDKPDIDIGGKIKIPKIEDAAIKPETPAEDAGTPQPKQTSGIRVSKSGDTLSNIASESGISLQQLLELNPKFKQNPNALGIGESIKLSSAPAAPTTPTTPGLGLSGVTVPASQPSSATVAPVAPASSTMPTPPATQVSAKEYAIASGDTLSAIALKNKTTVAELAKLNNIADPNKIYAGQKIKLL